MLIYQFILKILHNLLHLSINLPFLSYFLVIFDMVKQLCCQLLFFKEKLINLLTFDLKQYIIEMNCFIIIISILLSSSINLVEKLLKKIFSKLWKKFLYRKTITKFWLQLKTFTSWHWLALTNICVEGLGIYASSGCMVHFWYNSQR